MRDIEEMALITHQAVVDTLPASIRRDFEEPEPGELWRLPQVPIHFEITGWDGRTSYRRWPDATP